MQEHRNNRRMKMFEKCGYDHCPTILDYLSVEMMHKLEE